MAHMQYATKNLLPRLAKLDGILQQRVSQLEDEIGLNFTILMTITSMMGVVLIMTLMRAMLVVSNEWTQLFHLPSSQLLQGFHLFVLARMLLQQLKSNLLR